MSSSAALRDVIRLTGGASRLIPGMPTRAVPSRAKSRVALVDSRVWAEKQPQRPVSSKSFLRMLAEALLPAPAAAQGWALARKVGADLFLVAFNLLLVLHAHLLPQLLVSPAGTIHEHARQSHHPPSHLGLALLYGVVTTLLCYSEKEYETAPLRSTRTQTLAVCRAVGWATALLISALCLSGLAPVSFAVAESALLNAAAMIAWRWWAGRRLAKKGAAGYGVKNVLIVGAGRVGRELARYLQSHPQVRRVVKGFLDQENFGDARVLGRVEDLAWIARAKFADEIIITIPHQQQVARRAALEARRNHLDVRVVPDLLGFELQAPVMEPAGNLPLLTLYEEPVPAAGMFVKRLLDVALSALALALAAPLMAVLALAVKLDSPGPVFHRALRVGKKGRCFLCCKFRSMVANAEQWKAKLRQRNERQGPFFKISDDPRITRVGRFLRRYSLDELPQLWNVLRGEMSLVGPRPHPVDDCQRYELDHLRRLDVTPGITGLWQVTARQDPSFAKNLALDLEYIEQWSLWMDLRILFKTVSVVLAGSGA